MPGESEGRPAPPPPPPPSPNVSLTQAQIDREDAVAKFFGKLTEVAEVGRSYLQQAAENDLEERRRDMAAREQRRQRAMAGRPTA